MWCPFWYASNNLSQPQAASVCLGKSCCSFSAQESKCWNTAVALDFSLRYGTPKSFCAATCLFLHVYPLSPDPNLSILHQKDPCRSAGEEMRASANINDNQRLSEAKRHRRLSLPSTSSSINPRWSKYKIAQLFTSLCLNLWSPCSCVGYYAYLETPAARNSEIKHENQTVNKNIKGEPKICTNIYCPK